jgi:hypothetical protein
MRSSPLQALLTFLLLGLLLAPEGLLLHRCACGKIFDCCCRMKMKTSESCRLQHAKAHCSGGGSRQDAPSSLQNRQEPVDRFGAALAARLGVRLGFMGRVSEPPRSVLADLFPCPPVPPPRCPGFA